MRSLVCALGSLCYSVIQCKSYNRGGPCEVWKSCPLVPERDVAIQRARTAQNRDVHTQVRACLLLGRYYKEQGELDKAEGLYQRALAKARQLQEHELEADACSGLGTYVPSQGAAGRSG